MSRQVSQSVIPRNMLRRFIIEPTRRQISLSRTTSLVRNRSTYIHPVENHNSTGTTRPYIMTRRSLLRQLSLTRSTTRIKVNTPRVKTMIPLLLNRQLAQPRVSSQRTRSHNRIIPHHGHLNRIVPNIRGSHKRLQNR